MVGTSSPQRTFHPCVQCEAQFTLQRQQFEHMVEQTTQQALTASQSSAVQLASMSRRDAYRAETMEQLMRENQRLRAALDNPDSAARNAAFLKRTVEESLDDSNALRVAELIKVNNDLTVDRNRILAELNRLKAAHARELQDLQAAHDAVVKELESKLFAVNNMLHHSNGARLVKRLAECKKEIFELREALFVMQQEVRKTKLFVMTEKPFDGIGQAVAILGAARDKAESERNGALLFTNRVRLTFSDLWCGTPQLDHLRKDLGRNDDATKLVGAVRELTSLYLDVVSTKLSKPSCEVQCNLGLPEPKPVTNAGCQTPAEWAIAAVASSPPPTRRRISAAASVRRPTVVSSVASDGPPLSKSSQRLSIDSALQRPWSRLSSNAASRRPSRDSTAVTSQQSDDVESVGEEEQEEEEQDIDEMQESTEEPVVLQQPEPPIDDEALHSAVDAFRAFRLRRRALGTWLHRYHDRQVARLEALVLKKLEVGSAKSPRKPPVPPIQHLQTQGAASVTTPNSGRSTVTTFTREDRPLSARLGTWVALSHSAVAVKTIRSQRRAQQPPVPTPPMTPKESPSPAAAAPVGSLLLKEFGGGWRYGHVRTVVPSHRPFSRMSLGSDYVVTTQAQTFEELVDETITLKAMTPRSEMAYMTTATVPRVAECSPKTVEVDAPTPL